MKNPILASAVVITLTASLAGAGGGSPRVHRASVRSNGDQALNGPSLNSSVSDNGRFVVFESDADNLVANDDNDAYDVFVRDRETGKTRRVSVRSNGDEGELGEDSFDAGISASGQFIVFVSDAENLVPNDDNGFRDIFLHNRKTDNTQRVNVLGGDQTEGVSTNPAISANGKVVAFASQDEDLVPGDDNMRQDIFVYVRETGNIRRVNVRSNGDQTEGEATFTPALSGNGRYVAFWSFTDDLVANDGNAQGDVFVHDRETKKTKRVSVRSNGDEATGGGSTNPELSNSGRFIAYESHAVDLVANDENTVEDIFLYNRKTGKTRRVSVSSQGVEGDGSAEHSGLTPNGRYVVFESHAENLVGNDDNGQQDCFRYDRVTKKTIRVGLRSNGQQTLTGSCSYPEISANGHLVVFESDATDLVSGDTNTFADVFVRGPIP